MPAAEPPWTNKTSGVAPRNGTTSHTISLGFTSTAGRELVVVVFGPVTHTVAGWTERLQPASSGELSVFTTTSTGESSITITHNGTNFSVAWAAYEFPSGTTWTAGVGSSTTTADTFPQLTGLPGSEVVVFAARGRSSSNAAGTGADTIWTAPWVEDVDQFDPKVGTGTDGCYLTVGHQINVTATSITPTAATTYAGSWNVADREHVVFAVAVPDGTPPPAPETPIEAENRQTGVDKTTWDVSGAGDPTIQGFAMAMSVAQGTGLDVKVHSPNAAWTGKVYRLGWYGSRGAREVATITGPQTTQPSGTTDATTGMVSCSNWTVNGTWSVPADATPGVYVIRIARNDLPNAASHVGPFVVTDPGRKAKIAVKLSDSTWQAYNHAGANPADPFAGKNLYGVGTASTFTFDTAQRCKAVSYDRPLVTRKSLPQTSLWNAEYPLLRWLERLGYDVDYLTCAQVDADPSLLLGRDVVISSGHDEYWSAGMREAVVSARDSTTDPTHLVFLSGNEAFWRINWAPGRRSYACWKDSLDAALNSTGVYSGTWQDTRSFNTDRRPAALLNGQRFRVNGIASLAMAATAAHASSPLWRSTPVAALTGSQSWTSPVGIVGFEADEPADTSATEKPAGLIRLSQVTHQITGMLSDDNGATYNGSGAFTHALTAYRSSITGAAVFAFGTCQYAWALDDVHDRYPGSSTVTPVLQQALTNLLADLGQVPPAYPFPAGLVLPTPVALSTYGLPNPAPGPDPDPDPEDPLYGYATIGQLNEHLGRTPVNAAQLLRRASRDVDRALLCAVYDADDPDVVLALREATLEQVAANLDAGNVTGNGGGRAGGFTIGRLTVQASSDPHDRPVKIGPVWEQAWDILQSAGLTGHGPQGR